MVPWALSIGSYVFAQHVSVPNTDKQTDTQTTLRTTSVTSYALLACDAAYNKVSLKGRNRTGPPCSVGHPTAHAPGGCPTARRQRYKQRQTPVSKSIVTH